MTVTPLEMMNTVGGKDPTRFDWQEVWYPVYYVEDLNKTKPTAFKLLDKDIVIWWDGENWRVFEDRCPHRLALLSEGRINAEGLLECPYHGWSFGGSGECVNIPQEAPEGKAKTSKRACVTSYPTAVRQGLLFVYPGQAENAATTKIPIVETVRRRSPKVDGIKYLSGHSL